MNTTNHEVDARLVDAHAGAEASARLRTALSAGTLGAPRLAETLVRLCSSPRPYGRSPRGSQAMTDSKKPHPDKHVHPRCRGGEREVGQP
ncbi:hypothetical protein [Nocardia cyriacigeorgica]|uniref:hypothetical protein n=1 Tax=Nocardia cyriacigeorgica TaxID=135487 RepID=UPI0015894250